MMAVPSGRSSISAGANGAIRFVEGTKRFARWWFQPFLFSPLFVEEYQVD